MPEQELPGQTRSGENGRDQTVGVGDRTDAWVAVALGSGVAVIVGRGVSVGTGGAGEAASVGVSVDTAVLVTPGVGDEVARSSDSMAWLW